MDICQITSAISRSVAPASSAWRTVVRICGSACAPSTVSAASVRKRRVFASSPSRLKVLPNHISIMSLDMVGNSLSKPPAPSAPVCMFSSAGLKARSISCPLSIICWNILA